MIYDDNIIYIYIYNLGLRSRASATCAPSRRIIAFYHYYIINI